MTILEVKESFGTDFVVTTFGDSLTSICRKIYGSDTEVGTKVLLYLNNRFDWSFIKPGSVIEYIPVENLTYISESFR